MFLRFTVVALIFVLGGCGEKTSTKKVKEPTDFDAYVVCQKYVKSSLKAPESAKFSKFNASVITTLKKVRLEGGKNKITYNVVGTVDSLNSFGANLRTPYMCTTTGITGGKWKLDDISID